MVDFASIAAKAKADHEAKLAAAAREAQAKADARKSNVEAAVELLRAHVQPHVERAAADIRATTGIESEVSLRYDVKQYSGIMPSISFLLVGPERKESAFRFKTIRIEIVCDGKLFDVYDAPDASRVKSERPFAKANVERIESVIGQAVERLLADYYQKARGDPRS